LIQNIIPNLAKIKKEQLKNDIRIGIRIHPYSQAIDWGLRTPSTIFWQTPSSSSEQRFSKVEYTYGWYSARPQ
jgi:hypothetical protein